MRLWHYVVIALLGTSLMCSRAKPPTKEETEEEFLSQPQRISEDVENSLAGQALADFAEKQESYKGKVKLFSKEFALSYYKIFRKSKQEESYGTYEWDTTFHQWVLVDSTYPADGWLFKWTFTDTAGNPHSAEFLIDSLKYQVIVYDEYPDSIPTRAHASLKVDNSELAWMLFHAQYTTEGIPEKADLTLELVGVIQVGMELELSGVTTEEIPIGSVHFWMIDYKQNNYRIDLTIKGNQDSSIDITLEDNNGWKLVMDISAPEAVVEASYAGKKWEVTGEITRKGAHAADIEGTIWDPDVEPDHVSEIWVVFPDGTKKSLEDYFSFLEEEE